MKGWLFKKIKLKLKCIKTAVAWPFRHIFLDGLTLLNFFPGPVGSLINLVEWFVANESSK